MVEQDHSGWLVPRWSRDEVYTTPLEIESRLDPPSWLSTLSPTLSMRAFAVHMLGCKSFACGGQRSVATVQLDVLARPTTIPRVSLRKLALIAMLLI